MKTLCAIHRRDAQYWQFWAGRVGSLYLRGPARIFNAVALLFLGSKIILPCNFERPIFTVRLL